ncbi:MAG: hypothetical protein OES09_00160 [Gammaproteobacteria bacterium]|nr:hypothetical protein [Gammaproteobacteria bacterium]
MTARRGEHVDLREIRPPDDVDCLLMAWALWRRPGAIFKSLCGQRRESIFGAIQRQNVRQIRPGVWRADEDLMDAVERIIAWLPPKHRAVLLIHYTAPRSWSVDRKRRKLHLQINDYYGALDDAKGAFGCWIDWARILKA